MEETTESGIQYFPPNSQTAEMKMKNENLRSATFFSFRLPTLSLSSASCSLTPFPVSQQVWEHGPRDLCYSPEWGEIGLTSPYVKPGLYALRRALCRPQRRPKFSSRGRIKKRVQRREPSRGSHGFAST